MLIAPLLLALLWLLFFFAGGLRHRQDVTVVARSGAWNHIRVMGERNHGHDVEVDPSFYPDIITWTGDQTADWFITINYHLPEDTTPEVTAISGNRAVPSSLNDWRAGSGSGDAWGAEHWTLSADYQGRSSNLVGQNIDRRLTARLKMDGGCWTWAMHGWQGHATATAGGRMQDAAVNGAADDMVSRLLVQGRVAQLFRALSVAR